MGKRLLSQLGQTLIQSQITKSPMFVRKWLSFKGTQKNTGSWLASINPTELTDKTLSSSAVKLGRLRESISVEDFPSTTTTDTSASATFAPLLPGLYCPRQSGRQPTTARGAVMRNVQCTRLRHVTMGYALPELCLLGAVQYHTNTVEKILISRCLLHTNRQQLRGKRACRLT